MPLDDLPLAFVFHTCLSVAPSSGKDLIGRQRDGADHIGGGHSEVAVNPDRHLTKLQAWLEPCLVGSTLLLGVTEVPRIYTPTPPSTETQNGFAQALRKVRTDVQPYDARKTFAGWMEEAGISRSRRRQYLGHQVGDVTEIYERVELARFLEEDGDRMKAYLGENMKLLRAVES